MPTKPTLRFGSYHVLVLLLLGATSPALSSGEHAATIDHSDAHAHLHEEAETLGRVYTEPADYTSADVAAGETSRLPPLPEGVTELQFRELFEMPIGPTGLEFTEKTRSLEGKRVRMLGFMVREDQPLPGRLLLAPFAFSLFTHEYGFAEDLPATTIAVTLDPAEVSGPVPFTPGLLLLTGTLELGNHEDPDGRITAARLRLDPKPALNTARTPGMSPLNSEPGASADG
ncbi:MAG: hypothetical protein R3F07_02940 [Opitutaceae bacterium]